MVMLRNFFKRIYESSEMGYEIINPFLKIYKYFKYDLKSERETNKKRFRNNFGRELDLDNPQTLNEKINWLKLNDRSSLHTKCADKFTVREYIADKIGKEYLIPLLYHTVNPYNLITENLPDEPFIIKTNHDSGGVFIVRDKTKLDYKKAHLDFKRFLNKNYYQESKEWQYKDIEPRILVEKLLLDKEGKIPFDYKMHCFNGKLNFTQVDLDRQENHTRNLYNREWDFIPCQWKYKNGRQLERPTNYEEMKRLAEKIAEDFIYVRVDFYAVQNQIYFGELTFHSESGLSKFSPPEYDLILGKKLSLPI